MRWIVTLLLVCLTVVAASCGGSGDVGTEHAPPSTTTHATGSQAVPDEEVSTTTTTVADETPASEVPEGPVAPDFTIALGEDRTETFTLSEEAKPVYMVFWAEW